MKGIVTNEENTSGLTNLTSTDPQDDEMINPVSERVENLVTPSTDQTYQPSRYDEFLNRLWQTTPSENCFFTSGSQIPPQKLGENELDQEAQNNYELALQSHRQQDLVQALITFGYEAITYGKYYFCNFDPNACVGFSFSLKDHDGVFETVGIEEAYENTQIEDRKELRLKVTFANPVSNFKFMHKSASLTPQESEKYFGVQNKRLGKLEFASVLLENRKYFQLEHARNHSFVASEIINKTIQTFNPDELSLTTFCGGSYMLQMVLPYVLEANEDLKRCSVVYGGSPALTEEMCKKLQTTVTKRVSEGMLFKGIYYYSDLDSYTLLGEGYNPFGNYEFTPENDAWRNNVSLLLYTLPRTRLFFNERNNPYPMAHFYSRESMETKYTIHFIKDMREWESVDCLDYFKKAIDTPDTATSIKVRLGEFFFNKIHLPAQRRCVNQRIGAIVRFVGKIVSMAYYAQLSFRFYRRSRIGFSAFPEASTTQ